MKIKDQIACSCCFGLNDTTFDEYAEEFGVTLNQSIIDDAISKVKTKNVQNILLEHLFRTIIRNCLDNLEIKYSNDHPTTFRNMGFDWIANGIASYLIFNGKQYTRKNNFYAAVNAHFNMTAKERFLDAIEGKRIFVFDENKKLRIDGFFYEGDPFYNSAEYPDKTWRHITFSNCYPNMKKFKTNSDAELENVEEECQTYIKDLTPEEVLETFATYNNGKMPIPAFLDSNNIDNLAEKGEGIAYIDTNSLPEFPYDKCTGNPNIRIKNN